MIKLITYEQQSIYQNTSPETNNHLKNTCKYQSISFNAFCTRKGEISIMTHHLCVDKLYIHM